MKQFKNMDEFTAYINEAHDALYDSDSLESMFGASEEDIVSKLISDGYDLDNLLADGHGYKIGGHTNGGWIYDDEVDAEYRRQNIANGLPVPEIRKR